MRISLVAYETEYAQHELPNGMRVVTASRPWSRTFAATLGFNVGWRNEPASQAGVTHLLEHLAFCGANRQLAEQFGTQGLYVNGQTAYEQTHFILSGHASLMPGAMQFFANILGGITADPETIAEEIPILGHELAAAEESPMDLEMRKLTARIIGDKNFGRPVLATLKGLRRIKPEELLAFHHEWFSPANATLTLVSPAAPDEALALAEQWLGAVPFRPAPKPAYGADPMHLPPLMAIRGGGAYVMILILHPFRPANQHPLHGLIMLSDLLGGGPHSALFRTVRQKERLAYSVGSNVTRMSDCSILDVFAMVQRRDISRALGMMLDTLNRMAGEGLDPQVFEEARQRLIRSLDIFEDNPLDLCNFLAFSPVEQDVLSATPRHYRTQLEAFTREPANAIAADLLKPERRVCVLLGPAGFLTRWRAKRVLAAKSNGFTAET